MRSRLIIISMAFLLPAWLLGGEKAAPALKCDIGRLIDSVKYLSNPVWKEEIHDYVLEGCRENDPKKLERLRSDMGEQADALVADICATSDVTLLKPVFDREPIFYSFSIHLAGAQRRAAESGKARPEINRAIMDYVLKNGRHRHLKRQRDMTIEDWKATPLRLQWHDGERYAMAILNRKLPEKRLPVEHYSEAMLDFMGEIVMTGRIDGRYYFCLPRKQRLKLQPRLEKLSARLPIREPHNDGYGPLYATVFMAHEGDEAAIDRLCRYLSHLQECDFGNDSIMLCALSRQRKVIDKLIYIMRNDPREKFLGYDCIPNSYKYSTQAAIALGMLDPSFPKYGRLYKKGQDGEDLQLRKCIEWTDTHELDLSRPVDDIMAENPRLDFIHGFYMPKDPKTSPDAFY